MAHRFEQRAYSDDKLVDSFRLADLLGTEQVIAAYIAAKPGDRFERFTGQTYLIAVSHQTEWTEKS